MNHLIGQKIAITSNKPQTTRNRIQTVYTDERGQIVFLDTPGIHKAKNKLGEYMVHVASKTLGEVDVILWLVEPTTYIGAGEARDPAQAADDKDTGDPGNQQSGHGEEGGGGCRHHRVSEPVSLCRRHSRLSPAQHQRGLRYWMRYSAIFPTGPCITMKIP